MNMAISLLPFASDMPPENVSYNLFRQSSLPSDAKTRN
jgi:hypothetical protein